MTRATTSRSRRQHDYRLRGLDLRAQRVADVPPPRAPHKNHALRRRRRRLLARWAVAVAAATAAAVLLRTFVVEPFKVPSTGMTPTLQVGDRIMVVKSRLLAGPIERGNLVVFHHPNVFACTASGETVGDLVQRVIAVGGETIWSLGNYIYVDGKRLNEPGWYNPKFLQLGSTAIARTKIPAGDYFLMGDNRADPCDSRSFGVIPASSVVGKVVATVLRNGHPHFHAF